MKVHWVLRGGESAEVVEGVGAGKALIYRVGVEKLHDAEVKLVRENAKAKILSKDSRLSTCDVVVTSALFIEVVGKGVASGWFELVGTC